MAENNLTMAHRKDTNHMVLALTLLIIISHISLGHTFSKKIPNSNGYDYGMACHMQNLPSPPPTQSNWPNFPGEETQKPDTGFNQRVIQGALSGYGTNGNKKTVKLNCTFNLTSYIL